MADKLTKSQIDIWLDTEEDEFYIDKLRAKYQIDPASDNFYKVISRMCIDKKLKRLGRGLYRKIKPIKPVKWREADETKYYDLRFPCSHKDNSSFYFNDLINVSPGDLIVIGGVSNYGKTALALNILGENVDLHPCVLMGNEYTTLDNIPSPKFKRRMLKMDWVKWVDGNNNDKFLLLPVRNNFEDYIEKGKINIIDWINLTDNFWKIGQILEDSKVSVGDGIVIAVLQKEEGADLARGKGFTRDMADVYFKIDPYGQFESRLTIDKVKDPQKPVMGRTWAFKIIDRGANLSEIREIEKCRKCWGKGYTKIGPCQSCHERGYLDVSLVF